MELDAFNKNHNVLGVEYCTGYVDENGLAVKGFYCHRDQMLFCCGSTINKYCCTQSEKFAQQMYQLEHQGSQTSVLNTRAVSMITLISASILTFIITIMLTVITINTCQRVFAKKFRSNCSTGICLANSCNNLNNTGNDLCRALTASIAPTTSLTTASLLLNNQNNVNNLSNLNNLTTSNTINEQINYSGPISNCSSTSTDQCTIDTNSTLLTNLSDTSNNNFSPNFNLNTNIINTPANQQSNLTTTIQSSTGFNRLTNAISSITNLLTNNHRTNLNTSDSLFHISGNDQLNDLNSMIINQPPPPSYEIGITQDNYQIQLPSSYYNELCT